MIDNASACLSLEGEEEIVLLPLEYNEILDIQRTIFELLTVGYNEKLILSRLCEMAEKLLPNSVASIMILDSSSGLMSVISAPSIPEVGHLALHGLKPGPGGGSCGNAVFRNEAQYVQDTKTDPRWSDIRQIAYDFNLCSCWSMPIRNNLKQAVGSFALSSFEHRSPSGFHKRLLENCAFIVNIVLKRSEYEAEIDENQKKLLNLAYYDQLTGLPNRQKIRAEMNAEKPQACVIFNIDDFKEINDFFGNSTGDSILRQVGEWFQLMNISPYRIGGDEFAILFYENFTWNKLHHQITTLMSLLEEKIFIVGDEYFSVRMSAGVAMGEGKLLTRADIALHSAKEKKIPISLYEVSENIEEIFRINIAMAATIRKALINQRIVCYYQPIVNLSTGKIDKYETLVRMIDENGVIVPPIKFLPIAKKTKLYPQITREVLYQACTLFATRSEAFSINLSDSDIRDAHTVDEIVKTITETGTASRIIFEILESEGIENYDYVAHFITRVKALGAKIAIDDFGTGYSNFENILKLNVDYIKIDGSLISGITNNERHSIIIDTIIDFAGKIGAKTVAEFVSDESIYEAVKAHGINYSQGYYTGKPEPLI
jgi:diguanylate cyclase (GGDEF)-like protein